MTFHRLFGAGSSDLAARYLVTGIQEIKIFRIILNWRRYLSHRRIVMFWTVAAMALTGPWALKGCSLQSTTDAVRENCQVFKVYDGDTMTVNCEGEKIKVRLYCIDAPELGQEPWGREARDQLVALAGSTVRIDVKDQDRYGRQVAEVWRDGRNLNLAMVRAGEAVEYDRFCKDRVYRAVETESRDAHRGVWRSPGIQQKPWEWRSYRKSKISGS